MVVVVSMRAVAVLQSQMKMGCGMLPGGVCVEDGCWLDDGSLIDEIFWVWKQGDVQGHTVVMSYVV